MPAVSAVDVRRVALFTRCETRATAPPDPAATTFRAADPSGWTAAIATSAPTTRPDERVEQVPEMVEPRNLVGEELQEKEDRRHAEGRRRGEEAGDRAGIVLGEEPRHRAVDEQHGVGVEAGRRREAEPGAEELGEAVRHRFAFAVISESADLGPPVRRVEPHDLLQGPHALGLVPLVQAGLRELPPELDVVRDVLDGAPHRLRAPAATHFGFLRWILERSTQYSFWPGSNSTAWRIISYAG